MTPGYSAERTLALPAFWRGAGAARIELLAAGDDSLLNLRGIARAQVIELKTAAGCPLDEIEEYREWLRVR